MKRKLVVIFLSIGSMLIWTLAWAISSQAVQIESPNLPEGQSDWTNVNISGFGDQNNVWVVALEAYDGYLYAGTQNNEDGAQIWRTTDNITWTQVISNGFGSVYTNTNSVLFDMIEFNGQLYASVGSWLYDDDDNVPGQIWRSSNGEIWSPIETGGFGDNNNLAITSMGIFSNTLYAVTSNYVDGIEIWRSSTGNSGDWSNVVANGFGNANNIFGGAGLIEYDGYFYINTDNLSDGSEIWRTTDGLVWTPVVTGGFGDPNNDSTGGSAIFDGYLYYGTRNATTGAQLYRSNNGIGWTRVVSDGFGDINNLKIESLIVFDNILYAGTNNSVSGMEVWRNTSGTTWEQDNSDGFGNANNIQSLWNLGTIVYNRYLYFGTSNWIDGGEVWQRTPDDEAITELTASNDGPTLIGNTTTFTATHTAGTNVSYAWAFGDETIGYGAVVTHIYESPGVYTATVTASNSANEAEAHTIVNIIDQAITELTASNDGPTLIGNTTTLTATHSTGTNVSYAWDFGDETIGYGAVVTHIYESPGVYTATVTASNSVSSDSATTIVTVNQHHIYLPLASK